MSTLLILLPDAPPAATGTQDYEFWFSPDAQAPARAGGRGERAPLDAMPKADRVMALLSDAAVSWHTVRLPLALRGPKLRSALSGVLEESLLEDPERLHLAVMDVDKGLPGLAEDVDHPETRLEDGENPPRWVAAVARDTLKAHLQAIQNAGLLLEAVFPAVMAGRPAGRPCRSRAGRPAAPARLVPARHCHLPDDQRRRPHLAGRHLVDPGQGQRHTAGVR